MLLHLFLIGKDFCDIYMMMSSYPAEHIKLATVIAHFADFVFGLQLLSCSMQNFIKAVISVSFSVDYEYQCKNALLNFIKQNLQSSLCSSDELELETKNGRICKNFTRCFA